MPKRRAPTRKKTLAEADSNGDTIDSAVAVARAGPAPPPSKKTKMTENTKNVNNGQSTCLHFPLLNLPLCVV